MEYDLIIPFYNDQKYLVRFQKQVNNQHLLPKNLIFIDDCNKDKNLKKKIREIIDQKINIIFIRNNTNLGPVKSINKGFKFLQSEYFRISSTDDFMDPGLALKSLKVLKKYKKKPYVFSDLVCLNEQTHNEIKIRYNFLNKESYTSKEVLNIFKKYQFKIYHNSIFFRTNFFLKDNIFNDLYGDRCDMLNLYYMSFNNGFCYTPGYLSKYVFRKGQFGQIKKNIYIYREIELIYKLQKGLFANLIKANLLYEISPKAIFETFKYKNKILNLRWLVRSLKYHTWKKIRFLLPSWLISVTFRITTKL